MTIIIDVMFIMLISTSLITVIMIVAAVITIS